MNAPRWLFDDCVILVHLLDPPQIAERSGWGEWRKQLQQWGRKTGTINDEFHLNGFSSSQDQS